MPSIKSAAEVMFFSQKVTKIIENETKTLTPEQKLWRAVLGQIVFDAFGRVSGDDRMISIKRDARGYLSSLHKDYAQICEWAGFDPRYIQRKVKEQFNKGENNA
jgi:hypothetical protein